MKPEQKKSKSAFYKFLNWLFIVLVLLMLFSTDAKAWLLRQMMAIGIFNTEIKKEAGAVSQAPRFLYKDEKGNTLSSSDLKNKVVFINFWATWCPPCRAEMPALNALYNDLKSDPRYVFLFINEDEKRETAIRYLQKQGYDIPLLQRVGQVPKEIFSGTLPTTIVLNRDGKIVLREEGLANYNTSAFRKQLKELLQ